MTPTFVPADGALHAPERNRYFYGKLMDVAHFEQEQTYFRNRQALVRPLTTGRGVRGGVVLVAGAAPGLVTIQPGAALDRAGRLIVVPAPVTVDAHQPTDRAGIPSGDPLTAETVAISLAYAESSSDPEAVLIQHCDTPRACADSTAVEGFVVIVRAESAPPSINYGCQLPKLPPPPDPSLLKLLTTNVSAAFPDLPADSSVPLGRVNLADGSVDPFSGRAIVFSNAMLWQVLVCQAQQAGNFQGAILRYVSGDNQLAAVSTALLEPVVVELVDAGGNPVAGSTVQFTASAGSISAATATTDLQGRAQTSWTLGPASGDQTVVAGAVGSPLSVTFHAQATKG
jgi:hypothetical protein